MRTHWIRRIVLGVLALVVILGLVIWLAGAAAKANLARQAPVPGQLVDVGGYKLHLHCMGQGTPPVILEAGLNDFSVFWARVQPEVAQFAQVCAYDRAGLGWSDPSPQPRTSSVMVQELYSLLTNANLAKPYILVGHSFGGALMRLYAHTHPDDVAGLVLVDAAPDELFQRIPTWSKAVAAGAKQFRSLAPLSSLGLMALSPTTIPDRGLPGEALTQYRAIMATTRYFDAALVETESFEENLSAVAAATLYSFGDLPLLVLSSGQWGEPLPALSAEENEAAWQAWQAMQAELVSLSTNSKQVIATESDHYIQLRQPELVIQAIREIVHAAPK